jgi:hypothetical protein
MYSAGINRTTFSNKLAPQASSTNERKRFANSQLIASPFKKFPDGDHRDEL